MAGNNFNNGIPVGQPQVEIVDETHTLEGNQFHMPITPPAGGVPGRVGIRQKQPPPQYGQNQRPSGSFSTGLCDCCSDISSCCLTCWCPCITFGRIAEIVGRGSTSCGASGTLYTLLFCLTGCHWMYSCTYRSKLKAQLGMPNNCCADLCSHCCCECCALCQEYRELQHRGYNPALGWHGNMERQNLGIVMPPQAPSGMVQR